MSSTVTDISGARSRGMNIFILALAHFFNDFYCNFLPILLPILIPKLGLSLGLSGILVMTLSLTANVLQPFFGYYMDKYNFNGIIPYLIPLGGIFICFTTWIGNFYLLLVFVAISGLAVSLFHPMGAGLVTKISSEERLSVNMSLFIAGGNLGFTFAPLILMYFLQLYGLDALPVLIIPSLLLGGWIYYSRLGETRFIEAGAEKTDFSLKELLQNHYILILNIAMGMRAWIYMAMATFIPLWFEMNGQSSTVGGWALTIYLAGSVVGGITGGFLNEGVGYKNVIGGSLILGFLPTMFVLMAEPAGILFYVMLFLAGGCAMAANPGAIVWGQALLPKNPTMASGMMLGLSFGLGGIGTMFTSYVAEFTNLTLALELTTALFLVAAVLVYIIPPKLSRS